MCILQSKNIRKHIFVILFQIKFNSMIILFKQKYIICLIPSDDVGSTIAVHED